MNKTYPNWPTSTDPAGRVFGLVCIGEGKSDYWVRLTVDGRVAEGPVLPIAVGMIPSPRALGALRQMFEKIERRRLPKPAPQPLTPWKDIDNDT